MNDENAPTIDSKPDHQDSINAAYNLAAKLLVQDWRWLLVYSFANALPLSLLDSGQSLSIGTVSVWNCSISMISVVVQLFCLAHLCKRIIPYDRPLASPGSFLSIPKTFLIIGSLLGAGLAFSQFAALEFLAGKAVFLAMLVSFPMIWLYMRFFFFFAPSLCGKNSKTAASISLAYTEPKKLLALYAIVGPQVVCALASACLGILSPDKTNSLIYWLDTFVLGMQEPLVSYLALAFSLSIKPETLWGTLPENYTKTILETSTGNTLPKNISVAKVQSTPFLARLFSLRHALKIAVLVLLIQSANLSRFLSIPPSVTIEVNKAKAVGTSALVSLTIKDPSEKFKGFLPSQLTLRGETGASIVDPENPIPEFTLNGSSVTASEIDAKLQSLNTVEAELKLAFKTDRRPEHLGKLKDLHVWYFMNKLAPITFAQEPAVTINTTST
jgi:hypothetical protein